MDNEYDNLPEYVTINGTRKAGKVDVPLKNTWEFKFKKLGQLDKCEIEECGEQAYMQCGNQN